MTDGAAVDQVRLAGPNDEDDLIKLCQLRHRETAMPGPDGRPAPLAVEKVRATIQRAIMPNRNDPDAGQAWIGAIGQRSNMEAAAYLTISSPWDQDALYLMVLWNFVAPDYRKCSHASDLLTFAKAFSRVLQMPLVCESTQHEPAKSRIIERSLSCKPFGSFYVFTPDAPAAIGAQ